MGTTEQLSNKDGPLHTEPNGKANGAEIESSGQPGSRVDPEHAEGGEKGSAGEGTAGDVQEDEDSLGGPKFVPPLYLQRYTKVAQIVAQYDVRKVVDFGCAECRLQKFLREIEAVEEVACVDKDPEIVERFKFRVTPDTSDYVFKRKNPLILKLYQGDVSQFESRLADYDAVTMVELIEHLYPETLEAFPEVMFGTIRPRLVVITTPNAEFNTLFPGFTGFRHPDHKFEWTRAQFEEWCGPVASQYGYTVSYDGVGDPTPGNEHVGHCSQVATFIRRAQDKTICDKTDAPYKLVKEQIFPHKTEVLDISEEILIEAEYYMRTIAHSIAQDEESEEPGDNYYMDIPLCKLMVFKPVSRSCDGDVNKLKEVLGNHGYDFSPDGTSVRYLYEVCHSEYSGLSDQEDTGSCHGDCVPSNQDGCQGDEFSNVFPSNEHMYIPGQFSDAEDDDSAPSLTFQYGKKTPSKTMWSYPPHSAADDTDWD